MKNIICIILMLCSFPVLGQSTQKEALAREVDEYVRTVNRAAAQFLNKSLSPEERIQAIKPHSILYDPKQVEQFKSVVLDEREPPEVRATALNKIYDQVPQDERLSRLQVEWLSNPRAPRALRVEALNLTANLSFSSGMGSLTEVYQKMLDDPELPFRQFAFTQLVIHGDARAQQRLIQGLENPESAPLPAPAAIGVLSMAVKKEYYPAVYKVLQETRDDATRLEAIRVLGPYQEARQRLIEISQSPSQEPQFREAALGALYSGDRENIVRYALPIVKDRNAPARLRGIAIQMTIDVRQDMAYRSKVKRADEYDRLIKSIAQDREREQSEVRSVADQYLKSVRPPA
ncbi:MAG TPA: hypothetical protein VHU81_19630 [Thermoanaerobaculia bacterium]|jgi:HEAT repeat protein|nr:hypothetical protein [Thermoanaerobaculia bacterium]